MNITVWIVQGLLAVTSFYSGICKSLKPESWLITHGQTGVVGLPSQFIKLIGIGELFLSVGFILPLLLNVYPFLTSVSAILFCVLMLLAMRIHYRLKEPKNVFINVFLFLLSAFVAYERIWF